MIKLSNIKKEYKLGNKNVVALKNINLNIKRGEYVYIIGPSGAGKSTLIHIIGLLDNPTKGEYYLDGKNVSKLHDRIKSKLRRDKIGFVFQNFYLFPYFDIYKNVEIPLILKGINKSERKLKVELALSKVGLIHRINHRPNELSGGEIQRVCIARALVNDPEILLADEPTGNLDTKTGNKIIEIFEKLNEEGKTLIIVTHNLKLAERGKQIIEMRDGEIIKILEGSNPLNLKI
jgi:putative ABC transport system ATP-binding protein